MAAEEIPASSVFIPSSVNDHLHDLYRGQSYAHYSRIPTGITPNITDNVTKTTSAGTPCVLGVDEAGRGPVIGPMVYGVFYLPMDIERSLLADTHHFDDSKVLTPVVRASLMRKVCTPDTDLHTQCGWAIKSLSARDIGAGMLRNGGSYNLNAQAVDATVEIIRGVLDSGVNVKHIFVDTIGQPVVYQKKLERIFPTVRITVEKKADSLFPCVSAASVVAKVSRDVSCEMLFEEYLRQESVGTSEGMEVDGSTGSGKFVPSSWGSGYPSDAKCVSWLKGSIDPVFGWGNECRFSWGTLKDMMEAKGEQAKFVDWPDDGDEDDNNMKVSHFFASGTVGNRTEEDELREWYGTSTGQEVF